MSSRGTFQLFHAKILGDFQFSQGLLLARPLLLIDIIDSHLELKQQGGRLMNVELQDAVTLADELAPIWRHQCPFVGAQVDEYDERILECRCFEGPRFLGMQDSIAVALDAQRANNDQ